jgi:hypothetical protein
MVNMLEAVYFATAAMLLMALVRFVMSRRATGAERALLVEKARRYFIISGVFGVASVGGYTMVGPSDGTAVVGPVAAPASDSGAPVAAAAPAAPAALPAPPAAWTLVAGRGAIGIGPDVTHEILRARLGDSLVVTEPLEVDGRRVSGTVLFPRDPMQRIEIAWQDEAARERPLELRVRGTASRWRLPSGVTLGSIGADGAPVRELRVPMRP